MSIDDEMLKMREDDSATIQNKENEVNMLKEEIDRLNSSLLSCQNVLKERDESLVRYMQQARDNEEQLMSCRDRLKVLEGSLEQLHDQLEEKNNLVIEVRRDNNSSSSSTSSRSMDTGPSRTLQGTEEMNEHSFEFEKVLVQLLSELTVHVPDMTITFPVLRRFGRPCEFIFIRRF